MKIKSFSIQKFDAGYTIVALTDCGQLFEKWVPNNPDHENLFTWKDLTQDLPAG